MKRLLPLFFLLAACSQPQPAQRTNAYFDLKDFLDQQVAALNAQKPLVSKTVLVEDQPETHQTHQVDWARELELFGQADLNKPAYANSYFTEAISKTTTTYRLKSGEDLPVQYLEVIQDEKTSQPVKVKATLRTKNYLYESERTLSLTARNGRLTEYDIDGFQQLFYGDPEPFHLEGRILE
jgi:hypothetical protein